MSIDYTKEIPVVIALLMRENLFEEANKIQDAFESVSTSTELLMGVKFYLKQIDNSKVSDLTSRRILDLIASIEVLLK